MEFRTTVVVEIYRVCCPDCGIKIEKVPQLPSKAPFSKRFEDAVGQACESAAARQVALRFGLASSTVRAIDLRYLERWAAARRKPALVQMGVDEIHLGKKQKFITVVSNLDAGEPVWFGRERKKETLDEFFQKELSAGQRRRIAAACVDIWGPYRLSIEQWAPNCRVVYDKFHVMQHANKAIDEVRRAEFFRKGGRMRGLVKGKRWLLLSRWMNLSAGNRQELNQLFALNRKLFKAYLLKESLDRLWTYQNSRRQFVVWRHTAAKRMRARPRVIQQELRRMMHEPVAVVGVAEAGGGGLLPIPRRAGPVCAFAVPRTALPLLAACSTPAQSAAEARLGSSAAYLRTVDSSSPHSSSLSRRTLRRSYPREEPYALCGLQNYVAPSL
jgi:transposase